MMWGNDGWWIVMWVWMALFWGGVILGAMWLMGSFRRGTGGGDGAHDILDRRLASGDIDVDEHRRLGAELGERGRGKSDAPRVGLMIALVVVLGLVTLSIAGMFGSNWDGWDGWGMGGMHGGGRNSSGDSVVQGGMRTNVTIEDYTFRPGNLEIPIGATVTWTNEDSATHDAKARSADWETERLSDGESDTLTFDSAGVYDYYCSIHPNMKARLRVTQSP